ncbi:MAG TPA: prolyl oligopeptidase family serine peptidase [Burkholderiales bacterium]
MGTKGLLVAIVLLLSWPASDAGRLPNYVSDDGVRLVEEHIRIPALGGRYTIATTILRPAGPGPFGAIVLNHGVPLTARERERESAALLRPAAEVFAERGYAVIMPLRRGFGATGGWFAEDAGSCGNPNYLRGEAAAADDIMAAYDFARRLPYVDASRMILAGQSAGGVASLFAAGTRAPKGLVAVLAFAAGRGGDPVSHPGVPCAVEPLAKVFSDLGRQVKVPVLFHYAANDLYFNATTSQLWFERFNAGGAPAHYVLQPPFSDNGHYIFSGAGARYWVPAVERFLRRYAVPFGNVVPRSEA